MAPTGHSFLKIQMNAKSKCCLFLHLQIKSNFHFQTGFQVRLYFFSTQQHGWLVNKIFNEDD